VSPRALAGQAAGRGKTDELKAQVGRFGSVHSRKLAHAG